MNLKKIQLIPFILVLSLSCAGFPSKKWIDQTRKMDPNSSKSRVERIVREFNKIDPKDRVYAIQTLAANLTPVGQKALLKSLDNDTIRNDPALKKLVVNELKKRTEKDTPENLLNTSLKHTDLLDKNLMPYLQNKLGDKAAQPLTKTFASNPSKLTPAVIDYFTEIDYEPARPVILKGIAQNPDLVDNGVANYFSENKHKDAPEAFFGAVQKKPSLLQNEKVPELFLNYKYKKAAPYLLQKSIEKPNWTSGQLLLYFGTIKFQKSAPFIKDKINKELFIESAIHALYLMDDYNLNLYILALNRDNNIKIRLQALRNLILMKGKKIRKKALPDFTEILRNHKKDTKEITQIGISFFKKSPYNAQHFELLKIIYKKNDIKATRLKALEVMASMRGISLSKMQSLLQGNLRGADVALLKKTKTWRPAKRKIIKKIKKNKYKCSQPKKYKSTWIKKLKKMFVFQFDQDLAISLRKRINNALISYASNPGAKSSLIRRAYLANFNLDSQTAKLNMKRGLKYPGSLSAIVWQINDEYKTDSMRIYALSDIFGIDRWKSKEIFKMVRKKCL